MEFILRGSEGAPEGSTLSMKVGDTRRQGPVGNVGKPYRFKSSPSAGHLSMKVELLSSAAPAQCLRIEPAAAHHFVVDFGGDMKVALRQREVQDQPRPGMKLGDVVEPRSVPAGKLQVAQKAASYLEKHDLVSTFQDMLHGLLVSMPEDPFAYIDEHMARLRCLAEQKDRRGQAETAASTDKKKVEHLLEILDNVKRNLPLIVPLLPSHLLEAITSVEFAKECRSQFNKRDTSQQGRLGPEDLLPIVVHLSSSHAQPISIEQCRQFVSIFDLNEDGMIQMDEFRSLVQFTIIAAYLESNEEGKRLVELMQHGELFLSFIRVVQDDRSKLDELMPFLPRRLRDYITSQDFVSECTAHFDRLDGGGSGVLDSARLLPAAADLCRPLGLATSSRTFQPFTAIYNKGRDGLVRRQEFPEFARFVIVMAFLCDSEKGQVGERSSDSPYSSLRVQRLIGMLKADRGRLPYVMAFMPEEFVREIMSDEFTSVCRDEFAKLDRSGNSVLDPVELFPVIIRLCQVHPVSVGRTECLQFTAIFDHDKQGVVTIDESVELSRFIVVMGYLGNSREHARIVTAHGPPNHVVQLVQSLRTTAERVGAAVALLPEGLRAVLLASQFGDACLGGFTATDVRGSSVLRARDLGPAVMDLGSTQSLPLTQDQHDRFVVLYTGGEAEFVSKGEFTKYAQFMMAMAFFETEGGQVVADNAEIALGEKRVEDFLSMLEHDKAVVHRAIPLLPPEVADHLASEAFASQCSHRFSELDKAHTGALHPGELLPVLVELSAEHTFSITFDHCRRFTTIFDIRGDGVVRLDEFREFARFLSIMSYLHSKEGQEQVQEGLQMMGNSDKMSELLALLQGDRLLILKVVSFLPRWLKTLIESDHFRRYCSACFEELDRNGSGTLHPAALYPDMIDMTRQHHLILTARECERFTATFNHERSSMISRSDMAEYGRFLMIVGFLQSQEGQEILDLIVACMKATVHQHSEQEDSEAEWGAAHMEYYEAQASGLKEENEALRMRMQRLESIVMSAEREMGEHSQ